MKRPEAGEEHGHGQFGDGIAERALGARPGHARPVEVETRKLDHADVRRQLRVGLTGEDGDPVTEPGQGGREFPDVDALAARVRIAAVSQEANSERPRFVRLSYHFY